MDDALLVAIVGIVGTLAGTVTGPFVAERMRRTSHRAELVWDRRITAYADLLRVGARAVDNAREWAVFPDADLEESDPDELNRLFSQIRVIARSDVHDKAMAFFSAVQGFNTHLVRVRMGQKDQQAPMAAAADAARDTYKQMEAAIRKEVRRSTDA
ncbi:hypothetical protein [Streptomyces sp. UG1]|uniref:hypothetical protein n=1 Tax=Streptomyces sp. UG1 TaxID=3417652 RepID=UPI003CF6F5CA